MCKCLDSFILCYRQLSTSEEQRFTTEIMSSDSQVIRISSKKSRKKCHENGGDRISHLPNSIISCILSCLPTKDAVRTSILSKYWKYKWTSIYSIDIQDTEIVSRKRSTKAGSVKIVERMLLLLVNVGSFHIKCRYKYDPSRMTTWICAILRHKVGSLKVNYGYAGIILPQNLLNTCNLKILELVLPCTLKVSDWNSFNSLTILHLERVELLLNKVSYFGTAKFSFPILETFELIRCKWSNIKCVEICAPKMTRFTCETKWDAEVSEYSIKITAGKLANYESSGGLPENIIFSGGSKVVYATIKNSCRHNIRLPEKIGLQLRNLLTEFASVHDLHLSHDVAKAIELSSSTLPNFPKLERLVTSGSAKALIELFEAAPSLKYLVIYATYEDDYDYDVLHDPLHIELPLEEVKFQNFSARACGFKLAKFLLKNAIKLQKCFLQTRNILTFPKMSETEIVEELLKYPKASACLTIIVL